MSRGAALSFSYAWPRSTVMNRLITRRLWSRGSGAIFLMLLGLIIGGCANDKTAILGRWEQTGCENSSGRYLGMTASRWYEIEFLKGDTVILDNDSSWNYSFPQNGYLNIGGNMGATYQYEITRDSLTLREGEDHCVFQRIESAASHQVADQARSYGCCSILLAAGAAGVYFIKRRGGQRETTPASVVTPTPPVPQAFCMHCGQPVQAGSKFCLHCGKPLS